MTITPDTLDAMRAWADIPESDRTHALSRLAFAAADPALPKHEAHALRALAALGRAAPVVAALDARIAAWRKLAFTINTRRLSDGVADGDEAAALEEAHHRAWAEVQRVDPGWQAAERKASK